MNVGDWEFYWREFINEVNIELNTKLKLLHLAYERRNDCIYNIKDNIEIYTKNGIDVSRIFDIDNRDKIYINKKQEKNIGIKLTSFIRSYNYIVYDKLRELDDNIEWLAAIKDLPREIYGYMRDGLNFEIQKHICKGNNYSFGSIIGYIRAYFYEIPSNKINSHINWGDTMKLRQKLLDAGIAIKTKDNPNGTPYIVYADWDWWIRAQYRKLKNSIKETRYYKFKFYYHGSCRTKTHYYEKSPKVIRTNNMNELIDNLSLPCLNKLLCICINFPDERTKIFKNNVFDSKGNKL